MLWSSLSTFSTVRLALSNVGVHPIIHVDEELIPPKNVVERILRGYRGVLNINVMWDGEISALFKYALKLHVKHWPKLAEAISMDTLLSILYHWWGRSRGAYRPIVKPEIWDHVGYRFF